MNTKQLDEWRARPMTVTVKEWCGHCETLKPEVEDREMTLGWYTKVIRRCCKDCEPRLREELRTTSMVLA